MLARELCSRLLSKVQGMVLTSCARYVIQKVARLVLLGQLPHHMACWFATSGKLSRQ